MRPFERRLLACALAGYAGLGQAADGNGLTLAAENAYWPRWQGRLALGAPLGQAPASSTGLSGTGTSPANLSLLGDYYLTGSWLGPKRAGGFRATSGIIVGARSPFLVPPSLSTPPLASGGDRRTFDTLPALGADAAADTSASPYLGFGYTGLSARGGWSFSADLGLVSQTRNGVVRLGRVFSGSQNLDDAVRDLRLAPLLQLGVSYAF